jgi:hypothetical protein
MAGGLCALVDQINQELNSFDAKLDNRLTNGGQLDI